MAPETRYAKKGDISIAYQVIGDGPIDLRARDRALLAASQRSPRLMRALGRPILHRQRPRARPKLT
jgi:hypothetical protein